SGPGSFTGLRVGLSAIKGLAETLHKPIATVSVLEALAALSDHNGKIAAALDAGRKEIFLGLYEKLDQSLLKEREELLTQQDFVAALAVEESVWLITSEASIAELAAGLHSAVSVVERPGSEMIARIGAGKLLDGETITVEALDANYLRRSDAEIFFKGTR
ncbi:MAG TPA: tRNA (adenosine(37)-N6)-threonylcarbamoyltransferase complex dimerization subunit type 1 TsaB, partial [Candidatus Angelobacter sp.]|nr:tRNA (adenosine(37)-N6)-threonylcarbamoyltransferase complex dimerization subunit type 1 TsaB [Candidatus Angelobacter sp.]